MVEIKIEGISDLLRRLKALPEKVQRVTLIKAVRAGSQPILISAQARVPRRSGLLVSRIQVKFTRRAINRVEASIGVFGLTKREKQRGAGDPYYAYWLETGHKIVRGAKGKKGRVVGYAAPRPFLRPALESNLQIATDIVARVLREDIERAEQL